MTSLYCLSLVLYMEAQTQSEYTQRLVASVVIERAKQEDKHICKSIKRRGAYSWMWDGKNTKVDKAALAKLHRIAAQELKQPTMTGRYFFNECSLSRLWKTKYKMIRSEKLCFY